MKKKYILPLLATLSFTAFSTPLEDEISRLKSEREILNKKIENLENLKNIENLTKSEISSSEVLNSENIKVIQKMGEAPKIGLVLSGGGAKGFAHIGVLRALEKSNIKIDYLSGNSMGAIVAALYSVGYSPDDIESILKDLDLNELLIGAVDRRDIPLEKRIDNINSMVTLRFDDDFNFSLPRGLRNSNMSYLKLKSLLSHVEGIKDFDKLPIPLRIVATDLNTGETVTFKEGDLARVLSASFAIPTLLDPVKIGDRQYVDGMLSSNFPVKELIDLNSDIIIGSNVGVSASENKEHDLVSIFSQLLAVTSVRGTNAQKHLATIVIEPPVDDYSPTDFTPVTELIEKGESETLSKIDEIKGFISKMESERGIDGSNEETIEIAAHDEKQHLAQFNKPFYIKEIEFRGEDLSPDITNLVRNNFKSYSDKPINNSDLERTFKRLLALDFINKIFYEVDKSNEKLVIDLEVNPSNTLRLDANYRTDYGTAFGFSSDLLSFGKTAGLTTLSGKVGDYKGLKLTSFYYYGDDDKLGFFASLGHNETPFNLYENGVRKAKYMNRDSSLKFGLATLMKNDLYLAYGVNLSHSSLDYLSGVDIKGIPYSRNQAGVYFRASLDTLNKVNYPNSGLKGEFFYNWGGLSENSSNSYFGPILTFDSYFPLKDNLTLSLGVASGAVQGVDIPANRYIKIGGMANRYDYKELAFPGYNFQSKLAKEALIFHTSLSYEIINNLVLSGKVTVGTFSEDTSDYFTSGNKRWGDYVSGGTISLGYDTLIGPISLALSMNNDSKELITHMNIGYFID